MKRYVLMTAAAFLTVSGTAVATASTASAMACATPASGAPDLRVVSNRLHTDATRGGVQQTAFLRAFNGPTKPYP